MMPDNTVGYAVKWIWLYRKRPDPGDWYRDRDGKPWLVIKRLRGGNYKLLRFLPDRRATATRKLKRQEKNNA